MGRWRLRIVVPPLFAGIHSEIPSGCLNTPTVQEPYMYCFALDEWAGSIYGTNTPDKGMIHVLGGTAGDFIMLLRMASDGKLMNCLFLEFSIQYFHPGLDSAELKSQTVKPRIRGDGR